MRGMLRMFLSESGGQLLKGAWSRVKYNNVIFCMIFYMLTQVCAYLWGRMVRYQELNATLPYLLLFTYAGLLEQW